MNWFTCTRLSAYCAFIAGLCSATSCNKSSSFRPAAESETLATATGFVVTFANRSDTGCWRTYRLTAINSMAATGNAQRVNAHWLLKEGRRERLRFEGVVPCGRI